MEICECLNIAGIVPGNQEVEREVGHNCNLSPLYYLAAGTHMPNSSKYHDANSFKYVHLVASRLHISWR